MEIFRQARMDCIGKSMIEAKNIKLFAIEDINRLMKAHEEKYPHRYSDYCDCKKITKTLTKIIL